MRNKTVDFAVDSAEGKKYLARAITEKDLKNENPVNRVILGDAFDVLPRLKKGSVDLLIVDPPYNLTKDFGGSVFRERSDEDYYGFTKAWLSLCLPLLKPDATVYVCSDWKCSGEIERALKECLIVKNRITWEREKGRGATRNWKNATEDIWYAVKSENYTFSLSDVRVRRRVLAPYREQGAPKDWVETENGKFRDTCPSNFWDDLSVPYWSMAENTAHPTQKPEKLLAKLILASSCEGDLVLDPFAGSGTTAVTAKKLGRNFIAVEKNPTFVAWAEKRLETAETEKRIQGYEDGVFWERHSAPLRKNNEREKGEEQ